MANRYGYPDPMGTGLDEQGRPIPANRPLTQADFDRRRATQVQGQQTGDVRDPVTGGLVPAPPAGGGGRQPAARPTGQPTQGYNLEDIQAYILSLGLNPADPNDQQRAIAMVADAFFNGDQGQAMQAISTAGAVGSVGGQGAGAGAGGSYTPNTPGALPGPPQEGTGAGAGAGAGAGQASHTTAPGGDPVIDLGRNQDAGALDTFQRDLTPEQERRYDLEGSYSGRRGLFSEWMASNPYGQLASPISRVAERNFAPTQLAYRLYDLFGGQGSGDPTTTFRDYLGNKGFQSYAGLNFDPILNAIRGGGPDSEQLQMFNELSPEIAGDVVGGIARSRVSGHLGDAAGRLARRDFGGFRDADATTPFSEYLMRQY